MTPLSRMSYAMAVVAVLLSVSGCSSGRRDVSHRADPRAATVPLAAAAESARGATVMPVTYSDDPRDLRVMSFNVRVPIFIDALNHWRFRREMLVRTIRNFDPDLLGTQEAVASQVNYLREQLSDYEFVGVGRGDGDRRGETCGVFFRRDRFHKLDEGHFWLSNTPEKPGSRSWGSAAPRMVTWVMLRDRVTGRPVCMFNTHFDHRGRRARAESAALLREKIVEIAGDRPVIITGDFNAPEDSKPYRTLIAGAARGDFRFVDTFRAVNRTGSSDREGTRHGFAGRAQGPRIDWIVTDTSFKTLSAAIDRTSERGRFPSDHFPVTAIVRPLSPLPVVQAE